MPQFNTGKPTQGDYEADQHALRGLIATLQQQVTALQQQVSVLAVRPTSTTGTTTIVSAGGTSSGPASGDLTGTYPNPIVRDTAITTGKIADNAVTPAKMDTGVHDGSDDSLILMGVGDGIGNFYLSSEILDARTLPNTGFVGRDYGAGYTGINLADVVDHLHRGVLPSLASQSPDPTLTSSYPVFIYDASNNKPAMVSAAKIGGFRENPAAGTGPFSCFPGDFVRAASITSPQMLDLPPITFEVLDTYIRVRISGSTDVLTLSPPTGHQVIGPTVMGPMAQEFLLLAGDPDYGASPTWFVVDMWPRFRQLPVLANTNAQVGDFLLTDATGGNKTHTLPPIGDLGTNPIYVGWRAGIAKMDSSGNTVTVAATAPDTLLGPPPAISAQYGVQWFEAVDLGSATYGWLLV